MCYQRKGVVIHLLVTITHPLFVIPNLRLRRQKVALMTDPERSRIEALPRFKVAVLGDAGAGKTSLINRYYDGTLPTTPYIPTFGADFRIKRLMVNNDEIRLFLWEMAGGQRYRGMIRAYYRWSHAALFVYDVNDRATFVNVETFWAREVLPRVQSQASPPEQNVMMLLVGTKTDLDRREVTTQEGHELANRLNMFFFEVSSMSNNGVDGPLSQVAAHCSSLPREPPHPNPQLDPRRLRSTKCDFCCVS